MFVSGNVAVCCTSMEKIGFYGITVLLLLFTLH